jgi:hypothetical protein
MCGASAAVSRTKRALLSEMVISRQIEQDKVQYSTVQYSTVQNRTGERKEGLRRRRKSKMERCCSTDVIETVMIR